MFLEQFSSCFAFSAPTATKELEERQRQIESKELQAGSQAHPSPSASLQSLGCAF